MELQSLSNHKTTISAMWDLRLTETMALPPPVCHFPLCRLCLGGSAHTCSKSYKQEEASWLGSITYPVHFTRHTPAPHPSLPDPLMRKIPTHLTPAQCSGTVGGRRGAERSLPNCCVSSQQSSGWKEPAYKTDGMTSLACRPALSLSWGPPHHG